MRAIKTLFWLAPLALVFAACQASDNEDDGVTDAGPPCEEGADEVCFVRDDCLGFRYCVDGVFGACETPEELYCDGYDDDCDGTLDETFPGLGDPCEAGAGACLDRGSIVCTGDGNGTMCDAIAGDPAPEACNAIDDDCDGSVDEGVEVGVECDTGLLGECRPGATLCTAGDTVCVGLATRVDEVCDGLDNDCDGRVDEAPTGGPLTRPCYSGPAGTEGVGACVGGAELCVDGQFAACEGEVVPGDEICDGLDNDCNGAVDDGPVECVCVPGETQPCYSGPAGTEGVGACAAGIQTCVADGSTFGPCEGEVVPRVDLCDGRDDDCNGTVDDAIGVGEPCTRGVGDCAVEGTRVCDLAIGQVVCDAVPGVEAIEVCNGVDDDCNGAIDDVPGTGEVCQVGVGECTGVGFTRCIDGEVACDAAPGDPAVEVCDARDNDCNGVFDDVEGQFEACEQGEGICRVQGVLLCGAEGLECFAPPPFPPAPFESCRNALDDDCDGATDEADCIAPCAAFSVDADCAPNEGCVDAECTPVVCDAPPTVIDGPGTYQGDSSGAPAVDAPSCATSTDGPEVYYSLALGLDTTVCVDTFGTAFDTVLSARPTCEILRDDIACNDDTVDLQSQIELAVTADQTVLVAVDGYGAGDGGPFTLNVALGPCGGCDVDADCPGRCVDRVCVVPECFADADCAAGEACVVGLCEPVICGDGRRMGPETCDDGNIDGGDGCSAECATEGGFVCDDPGDVEPDVCVRQGCAVDADCPGDAVCRFGECLGVGSCPADDRFEDNEVAPRIVEPGRYTDLAVCDDDHYLAALCPGGALTVDIYFAHSDAGDLDLGFFPEGADSSSETDDEQVSLVNDGDEAVTVGWVVVGSGGATNGYVMDVTVDGCAVDCADATVVDRLIPIVGDTTGGSQVETASCAEDIISGPEVRYIIEGDRLGTLCVDTHGSAIDTVLSVRRACDDVSTETACSDNAPGGLTSQVEIDMVPGERYVLVVDSAQTDGAGPFAVNFRDGPCDVCAAGNDCASGACVNGACAPAVCGDGFRAADEECDDGANDDGDGCSADCIVEPGFVCDRPVRPVDDRTIVRGFTHCGAFGDPQSTTGTGGLPQGDYRLFYTDGAVSVGGGNWRVGAAIQVGGVEAARFPTVGANSRAGAVAAARGSRSQALRVSRDQRIQVYFADTNCFDNNDAITFHVRSVDACRPAPCAVDADCAAGEACDLGACRPVVCGDGIGDAGEACDDGNTDDGDGCSAACTVEPESVCLSATDEILELAIDTRTHCAVFGDARNAVYTPPLAAGAYLVTYRAGTTIDDRGNRYTVGGTVVVEGREVDTLFVEDRFSAFEAEEAAAGLRSDPIAVAEGERLGLYYGDIDCTNNRGVLEFAVRAVDVCGPVQVPEGAPCEVDADCGGGLCREGLCRAIGACPADDALEPNERPDTPARVEPGVYEGLASCDGSDDFYSTRVCAGGTLTVDVWFDADDGNIALDVFPPMGPDSDTDDERLVLVNEGEFETDFTFWVNEITLAEAGYAMRVAVDGCDEVVVEEPLCPDGSPLPACPDGFSPISDYACEQIRGRAATYLGPAPSLCPSTAQPNYGVDGVILPGGALFDGGFFGEGADGSRLNTIGVWPCNAVGGVDFEPIDVEIGLDWTVRVAAPGEYVMGISIDDFGSVLLDGQRVYTYIEPDFLRRWRMVPVTLAPGTHIFGVRGFNGGGPGAIGFELYGPFPAGSTADDASLAALDYAGNVVFSTGDRLGDTVDSGDYGYSCPNGLGLYTGVTGDPLCIASEISDRCEPVLCPDGSVQIGECPVDPIICPDGSEAPPCPDGFEADGTDCVRSERLAAQVNGFVYDVCRAVFDPNAGAQGVISPRNNPGSGGFFGDGAADSRIAATGVYFCRPGTNETADFATPGRMGLSIPFEVAVDGFYATGVGGGFEVEAKINGNRVGFQRGQEGVWRLGQLYLTAGQYALEVEIATNGPGQVGAEVYGPLAENEFISDDGLLAADFTDRVIASTIGRVGTQWDYGSNSGYFCADGFRYDGTTDPPSCFRDQRVDNCPAVDRCPEGFPIPACPEGYVEVDDGRACVYVEPAAARDRVDTVCLGYDNDGLIVRGGRLQSGVEFVTPYFTDGPANVLNESGIWPCLPGQDVPGEAPIDELVTIETCLVIEQPGDYVVGAGADDGYQVAIDDEVVVADLGEGQQTFLAWRLAPVRLEAGVHVLSVSGVNYQGPGVVGAHIYGPFPLGETDTDEQLQALDYANNLYFSTSSLAGRRFSRGQSSGYYCPADLSFDVCVAGEERCVGPTVDKCDIGRGALCGNGRLELDEICDDGNAIDGDGCSRLCEPEPGFVCRDVSFGFGVTDSFQNGEANPDWQLSADGLTITQGANAEPATYSTTVPIGADFAIAFDLSVQQAADDDIIGWTIGAGDTPLSAPDQPYLLFSWKQADQNAAGGFGFAPAGLRMGVVDGPISDIELWQFVDQGPLSGVRVGGTLGEVGWEDFRVYRVELIGDADRLIVVVDGELQFFVNGPLPTGTLGFYAYSQRLYTATLVSPLGLQVCGPE